MVFSDRRFEMFLGIGTSPLPQEFISFEREHIHVNGDIEFVGNIITAEFSGGKGVYKFRYKLPDSIKGDGVGVRFRLRGWDTLRHVAIGYTDGNSFRHIKIPNAARETWIDFSVGHRDIVWGIQNDWQQQSDAKISDIRISILNGTPGIASWLDVEWIAAWKEVETPASWQASWQNTMPAPKKLLDVLYTYLKKKFPNHKSQARAFMELGYCPLSGGVLLPWSSSEHTPLPLMSNKTYRYSWNALHSATILMLDAQSSSCIAAREILSIQLERNYFEPAHDKKYYWYDHGTAERLLAMLLMWFIGIEQQYDYRFMSRLRTVIFRHGQLLSSEAFYAAQQPSRYHNHAWFQDLALIATALAFKDFSCAEDWIKTGIFRLSDQVENLVVFDNGYAVFVENSLGYHHGIQGLFKLARELVSISCIHTTFDNVSDALPKFSKLINYPDGRCPAQGDTIRNKNKLHSGEKVTGANHNKSLTILSTAGYAVVHGNHENRSYMMTMYATSLSRTHKHEDNLAFTLFFDGVEWLIDPSFFSYEYESPLPTYLRSAAAHNNLAIPNQKYCIDPGLAHLGGHSDGEIFTIQGEHRAYPGIAVSREVRGHLGTLDLNFSDRATMNSAPPSEGLLLLLHCGDGVLASMEGAELTLNHPLSEYSILIELPCDDAEIYHDDYSAGRIRGVSGLGFMESIPIRTIECRVKYNKNINWRIKATESSTNS